MGRGREGGVKGDGKSTWAWTTSPFCLLSFLAPTFALPTRFSGPLIRALICQELERVNHIVGTFETDSPFRNRNKFDKLNHLSESLFFAGQIERSLIIIGLRIFVFVTWNLAILVKWMFVTFRRIVINLNACFNLLNLFFLTTSINCFCEPCDNSLAE